jgi:hypothetical protein
MRAMTKSDPEETYSEEETKRRADATLKVMLATPHKPHKETSRRGKPNSG